jgi:hypothetical protein
MTLEENRQLKEQLKKAGYIIKDSYKTPDEWVAKIKVPEELRNFIPYNDIMTIVDCSYESMDRMKYRKGIKGSWEEIWDYRLMKDFDLEEVLKKIGNIDLMIKNLLIEQKIQKIEEMF